MSIVQKHIETKERLKSFWIPHFWAFDDLFGVVGAMKFGLKLEPVVFKTCHVSDKHCLKSVLKPFEQSRQQDPAILCKAKDLIGCLRPQFQSEYYIESKDKLQYNTSLLGLLETCYENACSALHNTM